MLGGSGHSSPYWVTYKQAQDLGGDVRKGERSTPVVFWKWFHQPEADDDGEAKPVTHRPDTDPLFTRNGKPKGARCMLRYYRVFNLEQCDDIPAEKVPAIAERPFEPIPMCEHTVDEMPNAPAITHCEPQAY